MKRKQWLTDNQWGAYEHFAAETIGSVGWHPYPATGRQSPQPPLSTVNERATEGPATTPIVAKSQISPAAPPAPPAADAATQSRANDGPPYLLVTGKPPAVSSPDDEKARILATASALIPIMEALERSGKGKAAKPRGSKRQGAVAASESDLGQDEVEQDDDEVEDEDNVELAPAPRKTYARLARRSTAPVSARANRKRHERRCLICRHPERAEIEDEFIQWQHPYEIEKAYQIDERVVYRHARAVGLYARRTRNVRSALDSVLQNCYRAKVTGDTIVRAVRAYTRITDDGQWIDPPSHVIVSSGSRPVTPQPALPTQLASQYVIDAATLPAPALSPPANSVAALPALAPTTSNAKSQSSVRETRRGPRPKRRSSKRSSNRQRGPIRK